MHFHKVQKEFTRLVKNLALAFDVYNMNSKIEVYSQALLDKDYSISEVEKVIKHLLSKAKSFPTLPDFMSAVSIILGENKELKEENDSKKLEDHKLKMYQKDSSHLKNRFIEKFGEDKLEEWLRAWFKAVYPKADINSYGLGIRLFMPIFLQDFLDGKTLEGAIEITRKKNEGKRYRESDT